MRIPVLLAIVLAAPLAAFGAPRIETTEVTDPSVLEALHAAYPKLPDTRVYKTPMAGVYEVVVRKQQVMYFFPESRHMIVGMLWDPAGTNHTQARMDLMQGDMLDSLPYKEKGLRFGAGPNVVVEITNPDCPHCRTGHRFFAERDDVTRYVMFAPSQQSAPKAAYILSSDNPQQAMEEVYNGNFDRQPLPPFTDNGLISDHMEIARTAGVRGTPLYFINGVKVSGANLLRLRELLDQGPETAKNHHGAQVTQDKTN